MTTPLQQPAESDRAFPPLARIERYFPAAACEEARQRLEACVVRGEGPAIVIGAPGVGKTMLLEVLAAGLRDAFAVVTLLGTQMCTRRALLQAILHQLGGERHSRDEAELRAALAAQLKDAATRSRGVALLVDEAQALSVRLLEELRGLSNLAHRGEPIVRLVLAGGPHLEEAFASPDLEVFNQRLAARCYLAPMSYQETREYVRAHVAAVGVDPDEAFTPDALEAVFNASDGAPRLVNQVCDRALVMAVAESLGAVDAQMIQRAWSDLHQLPAPWHTPSPSASASPAGDVVEYGSLDDPPDEPAERPEDPTELDEEEPSETLETPAPLGPAHGDWNADDALGEIRVAPAQPQPRAQGDDPFGDDFAEEEVVIDRFAALTSAFHAATPAVRNAEDPSLSALVDQVAPAMPPQQEPERPAERDEQPDEPEASGVLRLAPADADQSHDEPMDDEAAQGAEQDLSVATAEIDDSDVLIIEYDSQRRRAQTPGAAPREYRQLFTQLRRG